MLIVTSGPVYPAPPTIFPSFKILPPGPASRQYSPAFRIRPARDGESVPDPLGDLSPDSVASGSWIVEYIPDHHAGLVVRRDWLKVSEEDSSHETSSGGVPLEHLLVSVFHSWSPVKNPDVM
jgi:hypothetical protein